MYSEEEYIKKRRQQARHLQLKFRKMQVFPIQPKKVVFTTFEGDGGYCCNPRYIADELLRRGWDGEIIWLTKDTRKKFPKGIRVVGYTPWNISYHLSTAEIWIDNYRKPLGTVKRKGQLYIQTWHASIGFKAVGDFRGKLFPKIARLVSEADSKLIDYVISNSDYCTSIYPRKLLYSGEVLQTGSPRCDCLIKSRDILYKGIRRKYSLDENTKIVMYAPTFRSGNQSGKKQVENNKLTIDFVRLVEALENKTSKKWVVMLRLHPQLTAALSETIVSDVNKMQIVNVSHEDDMSQLLGAVDLLITDYSSCAFDALFAGISVIVYADDIETYKKDRGRLMWKNDELPFLVAENNQELLQCVSDFKYDVYLGKCKIFIKKHGVKETGNASSHVVDFIYHWCSEQ